MVDDIFENLYTDEDFLKTWFENNYKYIVLSLAKTKRDRELILGISQICENYGVSLKVYLEIFEEIRQWVKKI